VHRRAVLQASFGAAAWAGIQGRAWAGAPGLAIADRIEIQDLLARALWATDTGDAGALAAAMTRDAIVTDVQGRSWSAAAYGARLAGGGRRAGVLHEAQVNRVRRSGRQVIVESYWSAMAWPQGQPDPGLEDLALCTDTCVKQGGRWRIASRRVRAWNSATVHVGSSGGSAGGSGGPT
jgi:hypothetical protein